VDVLSSTQARKNGVDMEKISTLNGHLLDSSLAQEEVYRYGEKKVEIIPTRPTPALRVKFVVTTLRWFGDLLLPSDVQKHSVSRIIYKRIFSFVSMDLRGII
jgi:hypothetical protein